MAITGIPLLEPATFRQSQGQSSSPAHATNRQYGAFLHLAIRLSCRFERPRASDRHFMWQIGLCTFQLESNSSIGEGIDCNGQRGKDYFLSGALIDNKWRCPYIRAVNGILLKRPIAI